MLLETRVLANGKKYQVWHTGNPYINGEYPTGGYTVLNWMPCYKEWILATISPNLECLEEFFRLVSRNKYLPALIHHRLDKLCAKNQYFDKMFELLDKNNCIDDVRTYLKSIEEIIVLLPEIHALLVEWELI